MKVLISLLSSLLLVTSVLGRQGFGPGDQDWGFVTVRPGAHMFWWLYHTTADVASTTERPLVIWLQGGPGASSTGYGNFEELGPLDLDLNERNFTWVREMNVLFIDNPVGSGFSYVEETSQLTTNNKQIALDLVELMRGFYKEQPQYTHVPLYIIAESYGGKMASEFAWELQKEIDDGTIESNLKGVALGDSWISPMDSVWSWAPYLLNNGVLDPIGYSAVQAAAQLTQNSVDAERWVEATNNWAKAEYVIMDYGYNVDFYNILTKTHIYRNKKIMEEFRNNPLEGMYRILVSPRDERDDRLDYLMNGKVREALGIPDHVIWGGQSSKTFSTLSGDFMKPNPDIVELLLNQTALEVVVFTGQLDLIVATPGTVEWVSHLQWPERQAWDDTRRGPIVVDTILEGYVKKQGRFGFYWINRSGHMVPSDNPAGMGYILRDLTNYG